MEDFSVVLYLFVAMSLVLCCVSWKKYHHNRNNYIEHHNRIIGINTIGTIEFNRNEVNEVNRVNEVNEVNASKPPLYEDITT